MQSFSRQHFPLSLVAALLMAAMVAVQDQILRGLIIVPLMLAYFASLALFGLEHESATKEGWKKYIARVVSEFERDQARLAKPNNGHEACAPKKIRPEALEYLLKRAEAR